MNQNGPSSHPVEAEMIAACQRLEAALTRIAHASARKPDEAAAQPRPRMAQDAIAAKVDKLIEQINVALTLSG